MSSANLHVRLIETSDQLVTFCQAARSAPFLTIDTEFIRERTYYPQLCLVQVATEHEAVVIDALAPEMDLSALWELLNETDMPKVLHAASQDLEIFVHQSGQLPKALFDTQIAAMVLGMGDQIGYDKLIKETLGVSIDKSSRYSDWALRPLAKRQVDYAAGDVTHLRDAYRTLMTQLEQSERIAWVDEEMVKVCDLDRYQQDPQNAYKKLKVRSDKTRFIAILQQIAAWREAEAQRRDLPRGRLLRDDVILDVAGSEPTSVDDLRKVRGINDKMAAGSVGKALIRAVNAGLAMPADQVPVQKRKVPLSDHQTAKHSLLKMLLQVKAAKAGTAARLIASAQELEELARLQPDAWDGSTLACLNGWRYTLFGQDAKALIDGQIWIGLLDGRVELRAL